MFGHRVIGVEAAAKQVEAARTGANHFGHRVLGGTREKVAKEAPPTMERDQRPVLHNIPGPRVAESAFSIVDAENILRDNPAHLPTLYEAELDRAEGPRPEVLATIRDHLLKQEPVDQAKVSDLDALIEAFATPVPDAKIDLPKLDELEDFIAGKSHAEIEALRKHDTRKGAQPIYDKYLT